MFPRLFEIPIPEFLHGFLPASIHINSYGTLIAIGALLAFTYVYKQMHRQFGTSFDDAQTLFLLLLLASIIGGKFFILFEKQGYYFRNPSQLLENFGSGFVFYGSLIFAIPSMLIFLKKKNIPVWPALDIIGVAGSIVHFFGRSGCFMAGCCYGVPTDHPIGIAFHHPESVARPLDTPLHPTQLYSMVLIGCTFLFLIYIARNKRFEGQVFLSYILIYAVGRGVIEMFRGDLERGYLIENILSNSQFISLVLFISALTTYIIRFRKSKQMAGN